MEREEIRDLLETVASGTWVNGQCAHCCVAPHSEHADWCPVRIAREILERG